MDARIGGRKHWYNTEVGHIAGMLQNTDEDWYSTQTNLNNLSKVFDPTLSWWLQQLPFVVGVFIQKEKIRSVSWWRLLRLPLPAILRLRSSSRVLKSWPNEPIVRKLPAVETLGSAEIIASD